MHTKLGRKSLRFCWMVAGKSLLMPTDDLAQIPSREQHTSHVKWLQWKIMCHTVFKLVPLLVPYINSRDVKTGFTWRKRDGVEEVVAVAWKLWPVQMSASASYCLNRNIIFHREKGVRQYEILSEGTNCIAKYLHVETKWITAQRKVWSRVGGNLV